MAAETFLAIVDLRGVGIVAGEADHFAALAETPAEPDGFVVLQQIAVRRDVSRNFEYRDRIVQRCAGPEIHQLLARLDDAGVPGLVAIHADVLHQSGAQPHGVDDGRLRPAARHMPRAWAVAAFAPDGEFPQ